MYSPKYAQTADDSKVKDFIREHSFAILVNQTNGRLWATHIPLELSEDGKKLFGHIARANAQWKNFNSGEEVMAVFSGAHSYISSSWYDHENVPTWNYIAVHAYGAIRIIEGDEFLTVLKAQVHKYEKRSAHPVSVEKMTPEYLSRELRGLVGFEITITTTEAAYKLSQNRDHKNHEEIIHQLEKAQDHGSIELANEMKRNPPVPKS